MFLKKEAKGLAILRIIKVKGIARLLTTDITRIEVAKNLAEKDCEIIGPVQKEEFRERMKEMLDVSLPTADMEELYKQAYERHMKDIEDETSVYSWVCLESGRIDLSDIFSQYGEKRGLFTDGVKRHQFADAIVFELLKYEATADMPVFILSHDNDFARVARETENFEYAKTLNDLLDLLRMDDDVPEVRDFIESYRDIITQQAAERLYVFARRDEDEFETRSYVHITKVDVKQRVSIRYENEIYVFGDVIIRAQLPPECPFPYLHSREVAESLNAMDVSEARELICEVDVVAILHDDNNVGITRDDGKKVLHGDLLLTIGRGSHVLMKAEWLVKET